MLLGLLIAPASPGPIPADVVDDVIPAGWSAILVAEVSRGDRTVAILWPGFKDGALVDDDLVAWVWVHNADGKWAVQPNGNRGTSKAGGATVVAELLGGADGLTVTRTCGVPQTELAPRFNTALEAFTTAVAAKDATAAGKAYLSVAPAFPDDLVLYDDGLQELLIRGGMMLTCSGATCGLGLESMDPLPVPTATCRDGVVLTLK